LNGILGAFVFECAARVAYGSCKDCGGLFPQCARRE